MSQKLFTVLSLVFTACLVHAQTAVSASDVSDSLVRPIAGAKFSLAPVDATDRATGFLAGSTQLDSTPVCGLVSNGALQSGLTVVPTPSGIYYHIIVANRATGAILRHYGMTPITAGSWTLDSYDQSTAVLPVTALTTGTVTTLTAGEGASCGLPGTYPILLNRGIPSGEPGINWRGAWTATTAYAKGDGYIEGGNVYIVATTYSSGASFASTDTANSLEIAVGCGSLPCSIALEGTNAAAPAGAALNVVHRNSIAPSPVTNSVIIGAINVKSPTYGALGNGTADDTSALSNALAASLSSNSCIYFPAGAYRITAQLNWTSQQRLCMKGENKLTTYIIYEGTSRVTAAMNVATGAGTDVQFDIENLGFAANANALYAFHSYWAGGGATTNNVAFAGGSSSAVRNDFFNAEGDQRNWEVGTGFTPKGSSSCVNGITFGAGSSAYGQAGFPSNQFTLVMPIVNGGCSGTALNFLAVSNATIINAQISSNGQQLYLGNQNNIPSSGNTFNTLLLENSSSTTTPVQIYGLNNTFISLGESDLAGTPPAEQGIDIFGSFNNFIGGYFAPRIQAPGTCTPALACAAIGNNFEKNVFQSSAGISDAGIGTTGKNNSANSGAFTTYTLQNSWNRETPADSTSMIGSPAYSQAPVRVPWSLSVVGNGVYPITAALKLNSHNDWRAFIDGGFGQNAAVTGTAQGYEVNDYNNSRVTLTDGTTITFENNQTDGEFEATVANNVDPISFFGWVTIFPGGLTGGNIAPYAMLYNTPVNFRGGWTADGTLNAQYAYWLGPRSAPNGACASYQPTGSWVFSQDGKISFCKAGTWEVVVTAP